MSQELKIAVTGETGTGKSTFVNAFRGIKEGDPGAATTDSAEGTKVVKGYPHPKNASVLLYDLPGVGSTDFPADKYLKLVEFEKFDFFIIISNRLTENDVKLAQEIKKMGKRFFFVRSKIDKVVEDEQGKRDFSEKAMLTNIKKHYINNLQEQGFETPQVFLVSSFDELYLGNKNKHEFPHFREAFERELQELQKKPN